MSPDVARQNRFEDESFASRNPNLSMVTSASPPRINVLRNLMEPSLENGFSVPQLYPPAPYQPPMPDTSSSIVEVAERGKKREFLESLKEQMRLKEYRKKAEKQHQLDEDRRIMAEEQEYQYFGKGGAGGVRRDYTGHTITTRKFDPGNVCNLYGRETYNRSPGPMRRPEIDVSPNPDQLLASHYNQVRLQSEIEQELELERKLREEQHRRMILEQQVEEERVRREREELRLKYMEEREEDAKKRAGGSSKFVARILQSRANARKELSKTAVLQENPDNEVVAYKTNVKLQANLEPVPQPGEISTKEFVRQLPEKVKEHVAQAVDGELMRVVNEMRSQENRVMDNILGLKVRYGIATFSRKRSGTRTRGRTRRWSRSLPFVGR